MTFLTFTATLIGIIAFILILTIIVAVHELGHFGFARKFGILCREYSIGMGPLLWHKRKGETDYQLRAFPIGGFASIAGEEEEGDPFASVTRFSLVMKDGVITDFILLPDRAADGSLPDKMPERLKTYENGTVYLKSDCDIYDASDSGELYFTASVEGQDEPAVRYPVSRKAFVHYFSKKEQALQIAPHDRTLGAKPLWQQALVMFGGPLQNFLLAIVVFFIWSLATGFADVSTSKIGSLSETTIPTPAEQAGLASGDVITGLASGSLAVNVSAWNDIGTFLTAYVSQGMSGDITVTYTSHATGASTVATPFTPLVMFNSLACLATITADGHYLVASLTSSNNKALLDNGALEEGDIILGAEGTSGIQGINQALLSYEGASGEEITLSIQRGGLTTDITVKPYSASIMAAQKDTEGNGVEIIKAYIGISPVYRTNVLRSIPEAFKKTGASFTAIYDSFRLLFSDSSVTIRSLSGPVGIYQLAKTYASHGIVYLLYLLGLLSVNIGLLNLLPIPALDGGRLVFIAYEAITKKKPNQKVQTILITVTMILLLALMAFVTVNDIIALF